MAWKDRRILDLVHIEHPILLAPMAGPGTAQLAIPVAAAGGLGAIPAAMLSPDETRREINIFRQNTSAPLNVNFFCHTAPAPDPAGQQAWHRKLAPYYRELGLDADAPLPAATRNPFNDDTCAVVLDLKPEVASFHFGLPSEQQMQALKQAGIVIIASATTVAEARWVEARGADAVIAQGWEAGGHRGMFLSMNPATQVGTFSLVPQMASAVRIPVIAAGGITDARGIVAALALGAAAVQIGTAYLFCPEAKVSAPWREALRTARDDETAVTNVFTGRPARGIMNRLMREHGPLNDQLPAFPLPSAAVQPLRAAAEARGSGDFTSLWAGQSVALGTEMGAADLTKKLATEALALAGALVT